MTKSKTKAKHAKRQFSAAAYLGKSGQFTLPLRAYKPGSPMVIPVTVVDVRPSYGRVDVAIEPVNGDGAAWVDSKSVKIEEL